jgi:hypothetical protein
VPFGQGHRTIYIRLATLYTAGGLLGAVMTGSLVGLFGRVVGRWATPQTNLWSLGVVGCFALLGSLRDMGVIDFSLPHKRCQTPYWFLFEFGRYRATVMWGFQIGAAFFTHVHFMGLYILTGMVVARGSVAYGCAALALYWLGRALPAWVAWWLPQFSLVEISGGTGSFRALQVAGQLALAAGALVRIIR